MSAGPVIVINLLAILFVGVLLRGSDWHYGMRPHQRSVRLSLLHWCRSMKKDAKLKEKKSKAWKQRQGEQKQAQAKKQKRYAAVELRLFLGTCISPDDIPDRSHHLHLPVQAMSVAVHLVQHSQASTAC